MGLWDNHDANHTTALLLQVFRHFFQICININNFC
ncbi:unnamed protein product [Brassica napus]|uniref:(rape) hypothetical protein n=1 Tax=Brassica napus TaxID=3708 RepID=A0A816MJN7_BRANA|nr:unnamed protein product [Brassica napus]